MEKPKISDRPRNQSSTIKSRMCGPDGVNICHSLKNSFPYVLKLVNDEKLVNTEGIIELSKSPSLSFYKLWSD